MHSGNSIDSLFVLKNCRSKRVSSYDKTGGNHDWVDIEPGENKTIATISGSGIIRHIWYERSLKKEDFPNYFNFLV